MNFAPDPEREALRESIAAFCAAHLSPSTLDALESAGAFPADLYAAMARAGILRSCIPAEFGGAGGGVLDAVTVTEELARASGTAVNLFLVNALFGGMTIIVGGSESQKQELLPGLGSGTHRFAFGLTEPGAGSDAGAITARAERDGDDFVVHGTKLYTTGAADADTILTVVRTQPEGKASRGSSILLVPARSRGLAVRPLPKIAGNAFASCEVRYDGVRVPLTALLGGEAGLHQAWATLAITGSLERIAVAASSLGAARAIFEEARAHAVSRKQFGQPVSRFQAIQHALVDMATEIEAMRWLTYSAAWKADQGQMAAKEISMAKYYCSERVNQMALQGMKILGGSAYFRDKPMERRLREALLGLYAGGTTEIQKNLVARFLDL